MRKTCFFFNSASLFAALFTVSSASAWVELDKWKKPRVFGLSPSADTVQVNTTRQAEGKEKGMPVINKTSASALALYPVLDELVAGFNFGGGGSETRNIPTTSGGQTLKTTGAYFELAGLFAADESLSFYFSPGVSSKKAVVGGTETKETFLTFTGYGVWAPEETWGLGLGVSARKNPRKSSLIPIAGGAWQPTPEFRIDGWLPANLHARWKYRAGQALFARLELAGESALAENLSAGAGKTDVQLMGAQMLLGWSAGIPIGVGTGFVRIDPSVGFFKGRLTQTSVDSGSAQKTDTSVNPLADVRIAVAF